MEQLLSLIQAVGTPGQQEAASNAIISLRNENPPAFAGAILELIKSDQVPDPVKAYGIIFCWQMFPEELSDLKPDDPHPFDVIGEATVAQILTTSLAVLSSGNPTYGHLAATLFGRVAALQLHRKPKTPFVANLLGLLEKSPSESVAVAVGIALAKLCQSALPEQKEVEQVLHAVFAVLSNCHSPQIAAQMINILEVILEEKDDLLEEESFLQMLFENLMKLATVPEAAVGVLKCWNTIGEANKALFLPVLEPLTSFALSVVREGEGNELLCQALLVLKNILEIPAEIEEVGDQLNGLYSAICEAALKVISAVDTGDCDSSEAWEPHIAAGDLLRQLAIVTPDTGLAPMAAGAAQMLSSPEMGARYAGMVLMHACVMYAESCAVVLEYFKAVIERANDEFPRVRYMTMKCLKEAILRGTSSFGSTEEIKPHLLPMAEAMFQLQPHLSDVPAVARATARMLAALVTVDGFPNTDAVLKSLADQAMAMGACELKRPFAAVEGVIDKGASAVVLNYFPNFVELLQTAVTTGNGLWVIRELQETFQAYLIRFGPELGDPALTLADILVRIAQMNNQYSPEVLVTLGILIQRIPAKAGELVPIVIETCLTALTSWHDYSSIYDASMCITFVARAGDIGQSMLPLMEQMVKLIEDQVMPVDTRRAVIDAIAALAVSNPALYANVAEVVMGKIATFCMFLDLVWQDNEAEGQFMATSLGDCILQSMKAIPGNVGFVKMAENWLVTVVDNEDILGRLCNVALNVIEYLTATDKNRMLEIIQDSEDVGGFIVGQREMPEYKEQCQKILNMLGYQE